MRPLLLVLVCVLFTSCFMDDDSEPIYELQCFPKERNITFQDVHNQYVTYQSTTIRENKVLRHEVFSQIDAETTETEFFKFIIDTDNGCLSLRKHTKTIYSNDGKGNVVTNETKFPIINFYYSQFSTTSEVQGQQYLIIGENEKRKFHMVF